MPVVISTSISMEFDGKAEWKVKPIDCSTILKGVDMLRRISEGDIGWAPGVDDPTSHLSTIATEQPRAPNRML